MEALSMDTRINQIIFNEDQAYFEETERQKLTVAKRNDLIQQLRFNLSRNEQLCVLYAISKIKPTDTIYQEYQFNIVDFEKLLNTEEASHYEYMKKLLKNIRDKSAWVKSSDGKSETVISWFSSVTVTKGTGKVLIKFNEKLQPYLIDLHRQYREEGLCYTTYNLLMVLKMKSKYGIRLYELIKSYSNEKRWTFKINELKDQMSAFDKDGKQIMPKTWNDFNHFKNKVIEPAIADINNSSDLHIGYEAILTGNKVTAVKFFYEYKTADELREILSPFIPVLSADSDFSQEKYEKIIESYSSSKETQFRSEHPYVSQHNKPDISNL